jgi:uncharacterized protein (TIGR00369 family)
MDYSRFEMLQKQIILPENEQGHMESFFQEFCTDAAAQKERINERMAPAFYSCDAEHQSLSLLFQTQEWQANPSGFLHGGMIATAVDITAGLLVKYLIKSNDAVTVEMNCNYLRAIPIGEKYILTAEVDKAGKTLFFINVTGKLEMSGKKAITANLIYMKTK